jgi:predicted PurR-regulated permease PerM
MSDTSRAHEVTPELTALRFEQSRLDAPSDDPGARRSGRDGGRFGASWAEVPWRTIIGSIGLVVAAVVVIDVVLLAQRVVLLVVIAGFFAVVLAPPVRTLQAKLHLRRGLAIAIVVFVSLGSVLGLLALFVLPVRNQLAAVLTDLPGTVRQAAAGRGPVGTLVSRLHLEQLIDDHQASLTRAAESMQKSVPGFVGRALELLLEIITVLVMTSLMLSQSAVLGRTAVRLVPERHRGAVSSVSRQAAGAVSGYMIGNLLISLCAGVTALLLLLVLGVPNPVVIALWVAFADLIPLVGATLGAVVAVVAALLVSPGAGLVALVFFVLYQQFENSVLQVMVMSRTVKVNPLAVLLSVLLGVELFGFVGALLGIPIAGAITVVVKEIWRHRASMSDQLLLVSERGVVLLDEDMKGDEPAEP